MIKVHAITTDPDCMWWRPFSNTMVIEMLAQRGIQWTVSYQDFIVPQGTDVLICDVRHYEPTTTPTILHDRWDAAAVTMECRRCLGPNTIGIWKPLSYRTIEDHNKPFVKKWPCGSRVHDYMLRTPEPIDEKTFAKIKAFAPMLVSEGNRNANWLRPRECEKEVDVAFCGRGHVKILPYAPLHRKYMLKAFANLDMDVSQVLMYAHTEKPWVYTRQDEFNCYRRAISVVSPWGICEASWRDYVAVLSECIVIKPRQDIEMWPEPWDVGSMVWCEPDFSDLGECVQRAKLFYDEDRLSEIAVRLREQAQHSVLADKMAEAVKSWVESVPF